MAVSNQRILGDLPGIELPDAVPPTAEELLRRHKIGTRIRRLRAKIGPVHGTTAELLADEDERG